MPDLLAAMDDLQSSPLSEGVSNGGYIDLDPATITPEGMQLLQAAFNSRELRMAEDKVRLASTSWSVGLKEFEVVTCGPAWMQK